MSLNIGIIYYNTVSQTILSNNNNIKNIENKENKTNNNLSNNVFRGSINTANSISYIASACHIY